MPEEEEEEGFTFRDRRRMATEDPAPTPAPTPSPIPTATVAPEPAPELYDATGFEEGEYEGGEEESTEIPDVRSILALFMGELRNLAWLRMGLVANPMTGQIEKDLAQAQMAIDTVGYLAQQLEPHVAPEERLPLKAMVSDLRMNFVEQSKRS